MIRPRVAFMTLACATLLLFSATACQQAAETVVKKAIEQVTGIQATEKDNSMTVQGQDGETVTFSSNLSDELKPYAPPQEFKVDSSGTVTGLGGDTIISGSWKGQGSLDALKQYYQPLITGKGWKEASTMAFDNGMILSYTKDGNQNLTVTASNKMGASNNDLVVAIILTKTN